MTTALRADRISRKSASIPASAIRNISPSEPSESTNVLNCAAVFAAVCASAPGVPRKLSHLERTATRSNPSRPFDPMSMPTTSRAITFGIWYLRSRNGNIAIRAVSAMKRIRKEESFMLSGCSVGSGADQRCVSTPFRNYTIIRSVFQDGVAEKIKKRPRIARAAGGTGSTRVPLNET